CLSSTLRSFYLGSWYLKTSVSVPPQVSPPPPSPPPASDSTSAGERSPDGCHRWAFPSELPTTAQCVLGRVHAVYVFVYVCRLDGAPRACCSLAKPPRAAQWMTGPHQQHANDPKRGRRGRGIGGKEMGGG
ncbi:hypothetical protein JOQ06_000098, partial [Pogonophryne albipinna]